MAISAISSASSINATLAAQTALKKVSTSAAGNAAGGGGGAKAGGAAPASGTSSTSDNSLVYDVRDTNKDGVVSAQEALAYALKHPAQTQTGNQATAQGYTQTGQAVSAQGIPSSLNLLV